MNVVVSVGETIMQQTILQSANNYTMQCFRDILQRTASQLYRVTLLNFIKLNDLHKRSLQYKLGSVVIVVNTLVVINEVTLRQARLVLGWVTVCGRVNHLGSNQPPRSTQPGHPSVGRRNEYQ